MTVDKIRPILGHFIWRHGLGHVDQVLIIAVALVYTRHSRIGQKHSFVPQFFAGLCDANRVERRAKGGLWEKCDQFAVHIRGTPVISIVE